MGFCESLFQGPVVYDESAGGGVAFGGGVGKGVRHLQQIADETSPFGPYAGGL